MSGSHQLRAAIKRQLKARNLHYADLAQAIGLSEASVKRLLSRGGITLERLDAICEFLGTDVYELARSGRRDTPPEERHLSDSQETALAADVRLLLVFHLLSNDWDVPRIRAEFGLSVPDTILLLARLDRLKLIDLLPNDRVRLRVPRDYAWRSDGPVLKRHGRAAMVEFLRGDFAGADAVMKLDIKEFGSASMGLLRRRVERLAAEFNELAEVDASLPVEARRGMGMVLAMRPWTFSLLDTLRAELASTAPGADAPGRKPAHAGSADRQR